MNESRHKLLLVEDDVELASMIGEYLRREQFEVSIESNGEIARDRIIAENFDVVVIDIGLPGLDGISVCREVRPQFCGPILMLTARGDEIDEVVSLEVGADDYMAKPVRPRALLARLKVHLRRFESILPPDAPSKLQVEGIVIDAANRTVTVPSESEGNQVIDLTTAEFDLLWFLAERAGKVVSRNEIYEEIQGIGYDGLDRSIDLRISRIRKKIGDDPNSPDRIKSVRGVGYILATKS